MPLIEPNFIDQLRQESDLVEVVGKYVELQRRGGKYVGLCPFHDEKTPSFNVDPTKQLYYCFGCGQGGDTLSFIKNYSGVGFSDAVEQLAGLYGRSVPRVQNSINQQMRARTRKSREQGARDLLGRLSDYFQEQLRAQANGTPGSYLLARGINAETVQRFALGYAPTTSFVELFPEQAELLIELGLAKQDNQQARNPLADRLIFPIRGAQGEVAGFGARALASDQQPKYLNSKDSFIFKKSETLYGLHEALVARNIGNRLVFCEGYMDVVMLAQHGASAAVASLGTALTDQQIALGFRYADKLVFAFDGDAAGQKAASKAMFNALSHLRDGRSVEFAFLPEGEDPDSFVRQHSLDAWEELLQGAKPLSTFLQDYARAEFDLDSVEGRSRCAARLLPELQSVPEGYFQHALMSSTRKLLQLADDFQPPVRAPRHDPRPLPSAPSARAEADRLLTRVASMAYANPKELARLDPELLQQLQRDPGLVEFYHLVYQLCDQYSEHGHLDHGYFLGAWHDSQFLTAIKNALSEPVPATVDTLNANLHALLRKQGAQQRQARIRELSERDFISLSEPEQQELRRLLADRHARVER